MWETNAIFGYPRDIPQFETNMFNRNGEPCASKIQILPCFSSSSRLRRNFSSSWNAFPLKTLPAIRCLLF